MFQDRTGQLSYLFGDTKFLFKLSVESGPIDGSSGDFHENKNWWSNMKIKKLICTFVHRLVHVSKIITVLRSRTHLQ